jgi:hypothetical protein
MKKMKRKNKMLRVKSAKGPTLTFLIIGVVVFMGVMLLVYSDKYGMYNNLMNDNGKVINAEYASKYNNLTSQQGSLTTLSGDYSASSIIEGLWSLPNTFFTAINIGLTTIGMLAKIPLYIIFIVNIIGSTLQIPQPLIWVAITVTTIFAASMLIRAKRASIVEP